MKILMARLNHETNTFSPVPTPLASFHPLYGADALAGFRGTRTALGAFIELTERAGATPVTPVAAGAHPSGPVHASAYDELTRRIIDAAPGCDAILLDLHGAMVAENSDDGEGDLLVRLRAAAPGVPIGVALDLHGNITEKMVRHADVMVGFKTYPHVDMHETGQHTGRLLWQTLTQGRRHAVCWHPLPLMSHTLRSGTQDGAMHQAVEAARAQEAAGVPAVSVFAGFSLADIAAPCVSVVATGEASAAGMRAAQAAADHVAGGIWRARQDFVYPGEALDASLARAQSMAQGASRPVLLLDHGDNCMSGGTCDTTDVLQAALALGLDGLAVGPLCDPEAVARLFAAGVGQRVHLALGNKQPLASLGITRAPMPVQGVVRALSDGCYTVTGPAYTGQRFCMGRTALLDIGPARIVVTEQPHEPWDVGVFSCVGLEPGAHRYLLLKSRMYCRPVFGPLSAGVVECAGVGVTSSDYGLFPFARVRRPVFPLDPL